MSNQAQRRWSNEELMGHLSVSSHSECLEAILRIEELQEENKELRSSLSSWKIRATSINDGCGNYWDKQCPECGKWTMQNG